MSLFSNPEPDLVLGSTVVLPPSGESRQPFAPVRVGAALILGSALWVGAFFANNAVLLPARLQEVAPEDKVGLVAVLAIAGSIVALLANVLFGALSDMTRTRFGRRAPWMVVGSIGAAVSLAVLSLLTAPSAIVVTWCVFQLFLNCIVAPLVATMADRVPRDRLGLYSSLYAVGLLFGAAGSQIAASAFVTRPTAGMVVFAVAVLLAGPLAAILAGEQSNRDHPRPRFSKAMILATFSFPRRGARDYYFALSAKTLFIVGLYAISGYQFYILTDYVRLSLPDAGKLTATLGLILLGTSLVFGFISGPISDRLGRRKILITGSALLIAVAILVPAFAATTTAMIVFGLLSGIGNGVYNSVDQALNTEVLPSPDSAAKDLGILNMANTGGQILGPAVTSAVIALTGGYQAVFVVAAVIMLAGGCLITPIRSVR